jgi:hypothetical protein
MGYRRFRQASRPDQVSVHGAIGDPFNIARVPSKPGNGWRSCHQCNMKGARIAAKVQPTARNEISQLRRVQVSLEDFYRGRLSRGSRARSFMASLSLAAQERT